MLVRLRAIHLSYTSRAKNVYDHPPDGVLLGATQTGQLLENFYVPSDTERRVIHSMKLRPGTQADFL